MNIAICPLMGLAIGPQLPPLDITSQYRYREAAPVPHSYFQAPLAFWSCQGSVSTSHLYVR